MARSFISYVRAAFNARPLGMPIPPNWIGLAAAAIASYALPGILLIAAGVELAYLLTLASSARFQRLVDARAAVPDDGKRLAAMLQSLPASEQRQYQLVAARCREILQTQQTHGADVSAQAEALSRLVLVHLQLQVTRLNLQRLLTEPQNADDLPERIAQLQRQLEDQKLSGELRNSLEGQLEIVQQRLAGHQQAAEKLQFVSAELVRIAEQIELVREQSMLSTDSAALTERIDAISGSLSQTGDWIRQQQQILGRMDDITIEPPPLLEPPAQRA